jgi:hypothetical protein
MHTLVAIAAMTAIFAVHVAMMVQLWPRGGEMTTTKNSEGEI